MASLPGDDGPTEFESSSSTESGSILDPPDSSVTPIVDARTFDVDPPPATEAGRMADGPGSPEASTDPFAGCYVLVNNYLCVGGFAFCKDLDGGAVHCCPGACP